MSTASTIHLRCSDEQIIEVELEDVKCSGTIKEKLGKAEDGEMDEEAVYLGNINGGVLGKVLEWAKHHKGDPVAVPLENGDGGAGGTTISEWDAAYLEKQGPGDLFELIIAADYLDIKGLLELVTLKVAQMIKGKSVEEIRKGFHVKNDFSDEEYAQVLKENEWCEEK